MKTMDEVRVCLNPEITPEQLLSFYERNDICEAGYSPEIAARPLQHSDLIVAAFAGQELVGIATVLFDGVDAVIMQFSLDLRFQGEGLRFENGSLIERDPFGLGRRIGESLLGELERMGAFFISVGCLSGVEEQFYGGLGFRCNHGTLDYIIDRRPYVSGSSKETGVGA